MYKSATRSICQEQCRNNFNPRRESGVWENSVAQMLVCLIDGKVHVSAAKYKEYSVPRALLSTVQFVRSQGEVECVD